MSRVQIVACHQEPLPLVRQLDRGAGDVNPCSRAGSLLVFGKPEQRLRKCDVGLSRLQHRQRAQCAQVSARHGCAHIVLRAVFLRLSLADLRERGLVAPDGT